MRKTFFRVLCFLTLVAIVLSMVMSCADEPDDVYEPIDLGKDKGKETNKRADTEGYITLDTTDMTLESMYKYEYEFKDYDFGGAVITILVNGKGAIDEIMPSDYSSFVGNSIYKRNAIAEELLNIDLKTYSVNSNNGIIDSLRKDTMSGEAVYDLVADSRHNIFSAVGDGLLVNLFDVNEVDTARQYYSQSFVEAADIDGKLFAITGDAAMSYFTEAYATFVNLDIAKQKDLSELFDMVYMGRWTIEYQLGLVSELYDDNDGSGTHNGLDTYGFIGNTSWCIDPYMSAFEFDITQKSGGVPKLVVDQQKGIIVTQVLNKLFHVVDGVYLQSDNTSNEEMAKIFAANTALFMTNKISMYQNEAIGEIEYSIIPMPKLDGGQSEYMSYNSSNTTCLAIPSCTGDVKRSGVVLECLSACSIHVRDAFTDEMTMKQGNEYGRSMLDIIINGIYVDTLLLYTGVGSVGNSGLFMRNIIKGKSENFVSEWTAVRGQTETAVEQIRATFNLVK